MVLGYRVRPEAIRLECLKIAAAILQAPKGDEVIARAKKLEAYLFAGG
jgi:hypothetical protein